ncbi:MAG: hypothetical protein AB7T37_11050 [Dehalococcoidia bacterium]
MRRLLAFLLLPILVPALVPAGAAGQPAEPDGQWGAWTTTLASASIEPVPGAANALAVPLTRPKTAEFTVLYADEFPPAARTAFDYAVSIAERLVTSEAEIIIEAFFTPLAGGTVGSSRSRWNLQDPEEDPDLPLQGVYYPASLATAIRGARLDDMPDMQVSLNSSEPWYYGTDGRPGAATDFVTTALHEIVQQFGITSSLTPAGIAGRPTVFDTFIRGSSGELLTKLPAAVAGAEATGNALAFDGPATRVASGGIAVPLYAPAEWKQGSSASHLDADVYEPPDANSLLGPYVYYGWATHDPGPIISAMLKDIGWTVPGLGTAARLSISAVPSMVESATGRRFDVRVRVLDPVGALVRADESSIVTMLLYGSLEGFNPGWTCGGGTRTVIDGIAVFPSCSITGTGRVYFRASTPGLVDGASHVINVVPKVRQVVLPHLARMR